MVSIAHTYIDTLSHNPNLICILLDSTYSTELNSLPSSVSLPLRLPPLLLLPHFHHLASFSLCLKCISSLLFFLPLRHPHSLRLSFVFSIFLICSHAAFISLALPPSFPLFLPFYLSTLIFYCPSISHPRFIFPLMPALLLLSSFPPSLFLSSFLPSFLLSMLHSYFTPSLPLSL